MSFFPGPDPLPGDAFACDAIETLIIPRASDIGGFEVRRALPSASRSSRRHCCADGASIRAAASAASVACLSGSGASGCKSR